ncbi:PREDICTED: protein LAZ1 homolog 2 isoform X2 [Lupinus angustifolius]|uniref:protein LAZ1 homolog 2 isoform X2 n=1 Tax=Lupinus angustifolius TaxID=3871 RepID=UPI00092F3388|nr:PREDICTED: protein LAZ1 homolog 2 isoform X2 [Lupinus angustifolius]
MASNSFSNYEGMYDNLREPALVIGGCCVLIALVLSIFLIFRHLRSYTNPAEQKWIVAVISMVPIYATESILSLWNPRLSLACDILRNYYEAFALYSFGRYLISCLGGERRVIELLEEESEESHRKPLLGGSSHNRKIRFSTIYIVQMILKTVCAFLALILELCGVYGDGEFKWYYGYPYIAVVLNFSQMWALYCLVQFYNVTHERLQPIKPLAKFISFKAIVFATWWQGVGIALLYTIGVLPKEGKLQTGLQDFLICIEMAIAAVAHVYVFSAEPYHFLPASAYGKVTEEKIEADVKIDEGDGEEKSAVVKETTTQVEAPRTSVKESVQDIVVEGGQRVVKDVALTINQAIGPVEKGVTRIQQTFHHKTVVSSDDEEEESDIKVEKEVTENVTVKGDENA